MSFETFDQGNLGWQLFLRHSEHGGFWCPHNIARGTPGLSKASPSASVTWVDEKPWSKNVHQTGCVFFLGEGGSRNQHDNNPPVCFFKAAGFHNSETSFFFNE